MSGFHLGEYEVFRSCFVSFPKVEPVSFRKVKPLSFPKVHPVSFPKVKPLSFSKVQPLSLSSTIFHPMRFISRVFVFQPKTRVFNFVQIPPEVLYP